MNRRRALEAAQIPLAVFLSVTLAGCSIRWSGTAAVQGSGKKASETRQTSEFTKVSLEGAADVDVKISDKTSVVVEGDDNLLSLITTHVQNGALKISNQVSYRTQIGIRVYVTTPKLESADVAGSGRIRTEKVEARQFDVSVAGSGEIDIEGLTADKVVAVVPGSGRLNVRALKTDSLAGSVDGSGSITAAGSAQTLDVSVIGSGNLNLNDLAARDASVNISGSGSADVQVAGKLAASITGAGSISYAGNPKIVEKTMTGSGSIHPR